MVVMKRIIRPPNLVGADGPQTYFIQQAETFIRTNSKRYA